MSSHTIKNISAIDLRDRDPSLPPLIAEPQNTIAVLQKYDFQFKKQFGQNFLIDLHVLGKIAASADLKEDDLCLEIGPGIGSLTQIMAERTKKWSR